MDRNAERLCAHIHKLMTGYGIGERDPVAMLALGTLTLDRFHVGGRFAIFELRERDAVLFSACMREGTLFELVQAPDDGWVKAFLSMDATPVETRH